MKSEDAGAGMESEMFEITLSELLGIAIDKRPF